jgi:hypothetical protein
MTAEWRASIIYFRGTQREFVSYPEELCCPGNIPYPAEKDRASLA